MSADPGPVCRNHRRVASGMPRYSDACCVLSRVGGFLSALVVMCGNVHVGPDCQCALESTTLQRFLGDSLTILLAECTPKELVCIAFSMIVSPIYCIAFWVIFSPIYCAAFSVIVSPIYCAATEARRADDTDNGGVYVDT
jgi:hypothetical protein